MAIDVDNLIEKNVGMPMKGEHKTMEKPRETEMGMKAKMQKMMDQMESMMQMMQEMMGMQ